MQAIDFVVARNDLQQCKTIEIATARRGCVTR